MSQMRFFDIANRYSGLDAKTDPLVKIDEVVRWEEFRPALESVQLRDRLSFMQFLGLGFEDGVPDAKTVWHHRERLAQAGMSIVEKNADAVLVREMLAFAVVQVMKLEATAQAGAAKGIPAPVATAAPHSFCGPVRRRHGARRRGQSASGMSIPSVSRVVVRCRNSSSGARAIMAL